MLRRCALGVGGVAMQARLHEEASAAGGINDPLAPRGTHVPARARNGGRFAAGIERACDASPTNTTPGRPPTAVGENVSAARLVAFAPFAVLSVQVRRVVVVAGILRASSQTFGDTTGGAGGGGAASAASGAAPSGAAPSGSEASGAAPSGSEASVPGVVPVVVLVVVVVALGFGVPPPGTGSVPTQAASSPAAASAVSAVSRVTERSEGGGERIGLE